MNAPFDPVGIAEAALHAVEAGEGPLILSPGAPLESARQLVRRRHTQVSGRTIQHQQGAFFVWDGTHYRERARTKYVRSFMNFWTAPGAWTETQSWYHSTQIAPK